MRTFVKLFLVWGAVAALGLAINAAAPRVYAQPQRGDRGADAGALAAGALAAGALAAGAPIPPRQSPFHPFTIPPLYLQTAPPWDDDTYGNYPDGDVENTMARWGCFTTSAAMVVNYFGESSGFQTTPDAVNVWMRAHGGYSDEHGAQLPKVIEYARQNRLPLAVIDRFWREDDARLDAALARGYLAILGGDGDSHYVVAYQKIEGAGAATYAIHDPLYGRTTLAEQWDGVYSSAAIVGVATEWQQLVHFTLQTAWAPSLP